MEKKNLLLEEENIKNKIYTMQRVQVIFDKYLAQLYNVETRVLNQAVKLNKNRFPKEFMFQLTKDEFKILRLQNAGIESLKSQIVISSSDWGDRRKLPYVFTEQSVAMLSSVLKSDIAVKVSIQIMGAFVSMRRFITSNAQIFARLDNVERKQIDYDEKFERIFDAIENKEVKQSIFFNGQIFDAYKFVSDMMHLN